MAPSIIILWQQWQQHKQQQVQRQQERRKPPQFTYLQEDGLRLLRQLLWLRLQNVARGHVDGLVVDLLTSGLQEARGEIRRVEIYGLAWRNA